MSKEEGNNLPYGSIGIIALESCHELGKKIDKYLRNCRKDEHDCPETYLISTKEVRFSNGEGKVQLAETVRGKDIYILCDVGNYSCTYPMFGMEHHKGPDEHFQDIKRAVSAVGGKARRVTVIMPMLYASRQHRRKGRESMDCAIALQELERLGVTDLYSFDVHDPNVQNSVPLMSFENLYPTSEIVRAFLQKEQDLIIDKDHMLTISPDTGAMDRAIYYSSVLGSDIGMFYKRRDHSSVVDGKNPIVQHEYIGRDVENMDVLIVDDMIASGESVLDIVLELKKRKANRIFVAATFALFTEGLTKYQEFYEKGLINRVYSTNLTYVDPKIKQEPWYQEVDMAKFICNIMDYINKDKSISGLIDATKSIQKIMKAKQED